MRREIVDGLNWHERRLIALGDRVRKAIEDFSAGRMGSAEVTCRELLKEVARHPVALNLLARVALRRGETPKAVELLHAAIAVQPGEPWHHETLGRALSSMGDLGKAVDALREAIRLRPDWPMALARLAMLEAATGDTQAGLQHCRKALRATWSMLYARLRLATHMSFFQVLDLVHSPLSAAKTRAARVRRLIGRRLEKLGDAAGALAQFRRALELDPDELDVLTDIGRALLAQENALEAFAVLEKAVMLRPRNAAAHAYLADALNWRAKYEEAEVEAREALSLDAGCSTALRSLGAAQSGQGRAEEAVAQFERALQRDPSDARAQLWLARTLLQTGRIDEGLAALEKTLRLQPDNANAYFLLGRSRRLDPRGPELHRIQALLERSTLGQAQRMRLNFAAAKILDDAGDADRAFAHYKLANDLKGAACDPRAQLDYFAAIISTFDAAFFDRMRGYGSASELPIFIVGMPRSGSTLVEQIVASHPKAHGGGELETMPRLVGALPDVIGVDEAYPHCVRRLDGPSLQWLTGQYLDHTERLAPQAKRITDKNLQNIENLGLIAAMFPRARIIHCVRDPLDVCTSIYGLEFAGFYPYAYNLDHLGRFYCAYKRLMAHWRSALPIPMLEVGYEDLVRNQEAESRRIIEFCGLPWDDRCLDFQRLQRFVATPSFLQVRQPIYRGSVGRWRRFEPHLAPLMEALAGCGPEARDEVHEIP